MSEAKHMPGPWEAVRMRHGWHIGSRYPGGACSIAAIANHDDTDSSGHPRQEANARLIAAAPELLDVVKKLVECNPLYNVVTWAEWDEMIRDAKAAIAKATGVQEAAP